MKLTEGQKLLIEEYGHLFVNTGGNDIVDLIEREGVTYFNNAILAELQGCCLSQVLLLESLKNSLLLLPAQGRPIPCDVACKRMRYASGHGTVEIIE